VHLLLVEDDLDLGAELQRALRRAGFTCVWVRRTKEALEHTMAEAEVPFACALLDLGLPDGDGLELIRAWRTHNLAMPIIVLTARDALESRLAGLDAGADDYVIKPVAPEELAARIRAVSRRATSHLTAVWQVGRLRVDPRQQQIFFDDAPVALSPKEYLVLAELARNPDRVVAKHRLAQALAPLDDPSAFNALEIHIHNLRRKLGADVICTVRGVGYRLAT
jgi:two-component system, OmpR family, response regulator QseB